MMKKVLYKIKTLIFKLSIKTKLTIIILGVSLIAIIVGFSVISLININNLKKDLVNQSFTYAKFMSAYASYGLIFKDSKALVNDLKNLDEIDYIAGAEIYNENGEFFTSYDKKPATKAKLIVKKAYYEFQENELLVFEPIFDNDGVWEGSLLLKVSLMNLHRSQRDYLIWILIIILIVTVISIIFANFFQKIISRPILTLAELTTKISESNDYSIRISKQSNDEIGILYDGFNRMLEVIVQNQQQMLNIQSELKDSEEQFSAFMKMLPAAALIKEPKSKYLYLNKFVYDNFSPDNWQESDVNISRKYQKRHFSSKFDNEALKELQHYEESLIDNNDVLRYFETWKFPIQRKEKKTLVGTIAIDTTNHKLVEDQIDFYIKELERNNKELEEFNYVASHDLREPLRTITSYCELLREDIGDSLNDLVKEDIKFITEATGRMNILIQDLLQLSRAGRVEFEKNKIDLNELLSIIIKDIEFKIKETRASIQYNNLPVIFGDSVQMSRVFQNLLTNSLKFKSDKDPVIEIKSIEHEDFYDIYIIDNGIGIENHYFDQIFSAFKRLHSRDEYEGTGIGLAICKKIVERHNGSLRIESEPGIGSKFIIRLNKK